MASQTWNAEQYQDHASFVPELGTPVLELLNPQPGERILDVGCGDGTLTVELGERGAVVTAIDSSADMVQAAQARGLDALQMSGDQITFQYAFDAVFTNAALHWIPDAEGVVRGVRNALRPGGRFVGEFGGEGNIACLTRGMKTVLDRHPEMGAFRNPWYFPSVQAYRTVLEKAGFQVQTLELIPRPTPLKTGVQEWLRIFADHVISGMSEEDVPVFLQETEDEVRPELLTEDSGWSADYVRIRFSALRPV